jgi:hypothetical protein
MLGLGAVTALFVLDRAFGDFGGNIILFAILILVPGAAFGASVGTLVGRRDLSAAIGLVLWIGGLLTIGLVLRLLNSG